MKPLPADLIEKCVRGDKRAQQELYTITYGMMMGMSKRYYINVEDRTAISNEAFYKLLKSLRKKQPEGSFEAWCKRITMNTIIDDYRKNKRRKEVMHTSTEQENQDINQAIYNQADTVFAEEELENLLYGLPEMTRYVFNLFAIEGYSHAEIASSLQIADGTSKWHVSEARRLLKLALMKKINEVNH